MNDNSGFGYFTTFEGHQHEITVLKFSPCGKWLASGGEDRIIRIWKVRDGKLLKELYGNKSGISDIAWHEDVNKLATGGDDHSVKIWNFDLEDESQDDLFIPHSQSLKMHKGLVFCVAFKSCYMENSYEHMLASGSHDSCVIIWDVEKNTVRYKLVGHESPISAVDFNKNGSLLLSSSFDGSVRVWDTHNGDHLFTLVTKKEPVICARFLKEDDWCVYMAMLNGTIELWSFEKLTRTLLVTYKGHKNNLFPVFSSACVGKFMISGSEDGAVYVWPLSGGDHEKLSFSGGGGGPIIALDVHPHQPVIAYSQLSLTKDKDVKNSEYRKIDIWVSKKFSL